MDADRSPEELRAALAELSKALPDNDATNPLRLVKARVHLLLDADAEASHDAGIFLNSATNATPAFYRATAYAIRALAAEGRGNKGEAVQDLMALETMTGDPRNATAEVPTEPAWVAASLGGFLAGLPHPNPANGANHAYFSEWKQRLLKTPLISADAIGLHEGDEGPAADAETPLISEDALQGVEEAAKEAPNEVQAAPEVAVKVVEDVAKGAEEKVKGAQVAAQAPQAAPPAQEGVAPAAEAAVVGAATGATVTAVARAQEPKKSASSDTLADPTSAEPAAEVVPNSGAPVAAAAAVPAAVVSAEVVHEATSAKSAPAEVAPAAVAPTEVAAATTSADTDEASMIAVPASGEKQVEGMMPGSSTLDRDEALETGSLMAAVMQAGDGAAGEQSAEAITYPGEDEAADSTLMRAVMDVDADVDPLKQELEAELDKELGDIGESDPAAELEAALPEEPAWQFTPPPAYNAAAAKKAAAQPLWTPPAPLYPKAQKPATTAGVAEDERQEVLRHSSDFVPHAPKPYTNPGLAVAAGATVSAAVLAAAPPKAPSQYPKDTSGRGVMVDPATYVPPAPKAYKRPGTMADFVPPQVIGHQQQQYAGASPYGQPNKHSVHFSQPPGQLPADVAAAPKTPWTPPNPQEANASIQKAQRLQGESINPSSTAVLNSDTGKFGSDWTVKWTFVPRAADELPLRVGDRVWVYRQMRDGFAYGRNVSAGLEGWFPVLCIARKQ
ncbi:hypothetical protein DFJ74DRAFT_688790 [Hyaloraphidium curvatum]|nr:hypothetical protein DFJ74DRAFT_688790 [Hyaloraphidium curvatum]